MSAAQTVGQFYATVDAVLSQYPFQHAVNLRQAYPTALHQTGNKPDMFHRLGVNGAYAIFIEIRFRQSVLPAAFGIQMLLLYLAFRALIIFDATADGILAPVGLPAAERAAKIAAACIAWVGEEQDLAMLALDQVFFQVRLSFENTPNNPIVLRNNTADLFFAVPVRNELKTRLYLYYKKAKCSLISLIYLGIPSLFLSCLATIKVQRGFFFCKVWIFLIRSRRRDITGRGVSV